MKKPEAPCLKCEERKIGCHSICKRYIDYTVEQKRFREHVSAQKIENNALETIEVERYRK